LCNFNLSRPFSLPGVIAAFLLLQLAATEGVVLLNRAVHAGQHQGDLSDREQAPHGRLLLQVVGDHGREEGTSHVADGALEGEGLVEDLNSGPVGHGDEGANMRKE